MNNPLPYNIMINNYDLELNWKDFLFYFYILTIETSNYF